MRASSISSNKLWSISLTSSNEGVVIDWDLVDFGSNFGFFCCFYVLFKHFSFARDLFWCFSLHRSTPFSLKMKLNYFLQILTFGEQILAEIHHLFIYSHMLLTNRDSGQTVNWPTMCLNVLHRPEHPWEAGESQRSDRSVLRVLGVLGVLGVLEVLEVLWVLGVLGVLGVLEVLGVLGVLGVPEVLGVLGYSEYSECSEYSE